MSLDENKEPKNEETAVSESSTESVENIDSLKSKTEDGIDLLDNECPEAAITASDANPSDISDFTDVAIESEVHPAAEDPALPESAGPGQPLFKPGEAVQTVLINYHSAGPMIRCFTNGFDVKINMKVIAERSGGLSLATVKSVPEMYTPASEEQLPRIVRFIDDRDNLIVEENRRRSAEAKRICNKMVEKLNLEMKLIEVEYLHSLNKAIFYFSAEGRVDFRELIRELARSLHIRVEMCQIGVRDEAKLIGGLGPCGIPTCCSSFLSNFAPVSIKMAKEQNLTLNPEKVSGLCGRLICCLSYESQVYRDVQEGLPKIGKKADTWKGRGRVAEVDVFRNTISFDIEDEEERFICSIDEFREYMQNKESFIPWDERGEDGKQKKKTSPGMRAADASRPPRRERSTRPGMTTAPGAVRVDTTVADGNRVDGDSQSAKAEGNTPNRQAGSDRPERRNDNFRRRNDGERQREARRDDDSGKQVRPERNDNRDRVDRRDRPGNAGRSEQNRNSSDMQRDNRPPRPPRPPHNHERQQSAGQGQAPGVNSQAQGGGRPSDAIRQRPLEPSRPKENAERDNSHEGNNNNRNRHNRYNRPRNNRPDGGQKPDGGSGQQQ